MLIQKLTLFGSKNCTHEGRANISGHATPEAKANVSVIVQ